MLAPNDITICIKINLNDELIGVLEIAQTKTVTAKKMINCNILFPITDTSGIQSKFTLNLSPNKKEALKQN